MTKTISDKIVTLNRPCIMCATNQVIKMTAKQFVEWQEGKLLQDACPDMSVDDREILISSICPTCWRKQFEEEN